MSNATLVKFGLPATLIADYKHWTVMLRPAQVTLGSLILGAKGEWMAFSQIPPEAFAELAHVTRCLETGLKNFNAYDKINYLMLMMVDPHVHFHVIPRYATPRRFEDLEFPDVAWPGQPNMAGATTLPPETQMRLRDAVRQHWPRD
ncbi:HIT family protein [Nordella sp. HKS 07]|uniref:HIT family protein n=1 Tax=Nordella sp. HKS 07 TaxID=2712222 RepID=UPI0013E0FD2F|nr:HIT family protein [Nordella sp. HKS 07]QIG46533.1 HIT family protein [Nordella sp. HKS 07]